MYIIAFSIAVSALLGWFFVQKNDVLASLFRGVLGVALVGYGMTIIGADLDMATKFSIAFRDTLILGGVGAIGGIFVSQEKIGLIWLAISLLLFNIFVTPRLSNSLEVAKTTIQQSNQPATSADILLANDSELLIELNDDQLVDISVALVDVMEKYKLNMRPAFQMADGAVTELDNYRVVDIQSQDLNIIEIIKKELLATSDIVYVEDNEIIKLDENESRPVVAKKTDFAVNDPGLEFSWGFTPMKVNDLYNHLISNKIKPFKKARLAILDTGVAADHEDISDNYVSTQKKYDDDPKGHGTHCAGIAAAVSNNGVGIASLALNNQFVEVTSIKVLNSYGIGSQQGIINGILEAADTGADVISMSLGGMSSDSKQRAYEKAVRYANKKGAIIVVAAGNSNRNANKFAPANSKGVITVSAIDAELQRAVFSNYVTDLSMGIAAPGVNIYSTIPGDQYATYNGTSMATPYVAGLVALMRSINPNLKTKEVYNILNQTGIDTKATAETGKLIQPYGAMRAIMD